MRHGNIGYLVQRQHTPFTCCSSTNTMIPASPVAVLPLKHTTPSARKLPRPRIPLLPYSSRPSGTALSIDLSTCIRIRIQLIYHYYCIVPTNHKPPLGCAGWRPLFHFNTSSRAGAKKHQFPPCHLPVPRDAPPREIARRGGEQASSLPPALQSNKTCHLLVFTYTASVMISRAVCAPPRSLS